MLFLRDVRAGIHLKNRPPVSIIQRLNFHIVMSEPVISSRPASPCIRVCTLDDEQFCLGCGRHLDDIVGWTRMSATEQQAVCERSAERRARNEYSTPDIRAPVKT